MNANTNNESNKLRQETEAMKQEMERNAKIANLRMGNKRFVDKCEQFGCDVAYDRYLERADI